MLDFLDNKYTMAIGRTLLVMIYFIGGLLILVVVGPGELSVGGGKKSA